MRDEYSLRIYIDQDKRKQDKEKRKTLKTNKRGKEKRIQKQLQSGKWT